MPTLRPLSDIDALITNWKTSAWKTESNTVPNPGEAAYRRLNAAAANPTGQAYYDMLSILSTCCAMMEKAAEDARTMQALRAQIGGTT